MLFRTRYNVLFRQFRLLTAQAGSIPAAIRLIFENCYSGCSSVQFGVLFVGNGLTPFVAAIFAGNFHSNVAEPAVGLGTVPVLDVGRDGDHGAGGQADGRFALFLVPAFACGTNQQLAAALGGVVDVPVVAAPVPKTFCCSNSCLSMHFILVVSCFSVSLPCCA